MLSLRFVALYSWYICTAYTKEKLEQIWFQLTGRECLSSRAYNSLSDEYACATQESEKNISVYWVLILLCNCTIHAYIARISRKISSAIARIGTLYPSWNRICIEFALGYDVMMYQLRRATKIIGSLETRLQEIRICCQKSFKEM